MTGGYSYETSKPAHKFNGSDYDPVHDDKRLSSQIERIFDVMKDGNWRTLSEIEHLTNDPSASISAQLRNLRKIRFGGHTVNKRCRGERDKGLFEYQLIVKKVIKEGLQSQLF